MSCSVQSTKARKSASLRGKAIAKRAGDRKPELEIGSRDAQVAGRGDGAQFRVRVAGEAINGDDRFEAEQARRRDVLAQVVQPALDGLMVRLAQPVARDAAVMLERAHRRYQHHGIGDQARVAALDVKELFHANVGPKAALGDDVIGQLEGDLVGDDRRVAMSDVGKWPGVDKSRLALQGLGD